MKARMHPPAVLAPPPVDYIAMPGAPGRYFRCGRYGLMSVAACGQYFRAAPEASQCGRLHGCVGCPVGALHAGVVLRAPQPSVAPVLKVCVRCRKHPSGYGPQSNGRIRLVRQRTLCVSCFNREREVAKGRNAKGTRPRKTPKPFALCVVVLAGGKVFAVYLRAVLDLSYEAEGVIDRLWDGPPIEAITFATPAAWWDSLARRAQRPEHALVPMLVAEQPGAVWPLGARAEPFQAPQWTKQGDAPPDGLCRLGGAF